MNQEMPEISSTAYVTTTSGMQDMAGNAVVLAGNPQAFDLRGPDVGPGNRRVMLDVLNKAATELESNEDDYMKRIVRVLIVDSDEEVPAEQSVLHDSGEMLTDADDQELFFEINIKKILEKHNEIRGKIVDPEYTDRTEYLQPLRIRELKMQVVVIAQF